MGLRRRLRWMTVAAATALAAAGLAAGSPHALAVPPNFTFVGSGFGHGVGMSQYGAYGQALEGASATQILQHYYSGATVAPAGDNVLLRVNLVHAAATAQVRGEALTTGGGSIDVVAGATTIHGQPGQIFDLSVSGTDVSVSTTGVPPVSAPVVTVNGAGPATLVNVVPGGESLDDSSTAHRYRYGAFDAAVVGSGLEVVNQLDLHEEYLRGIAEMPASWPAAALQAQVVAARTYALRKFQSGQRSDCRCHVFNGTVDQVFAGWAEESQPTYGARWAAAVDATSPDANDGVTELWNGAPISANYFSSSGGRTENNEDVFGGAPLPYLRSVDDHWSLLSYNPMASWSRTFDQATVAAAFGLPDVAGIDLSDRTAGGSVRTAIATSSSGATASLSGGQLRGRFALPGAWLHRPVVRLAGADRWSTSVAIGNVAAPTATVVVLASGEAGHLVDGLVAAPLARFRAAPVLLATHDGLPDAVAAQIDHLHPTKAYLVGGTAALGPGVTDQLHAHGVADVVQLGGDNRYDTGLAVAHEMGGGRPTVTIASGEDIHLVDALGAAGPSAITGQPILLVTRDSVPPQTQQAISDLGFQKSEVIGGTSSISDQTMAQLPQPHRDAGDDRYATAAAVADVFAPYVPFDTVVVGSGADSNLVDALAGGALGRLTVLTTPDVLPGVSHDWLATHPTIGTVDVLGGPAAVDDNAFAQVVQATTG